MGIKCFFAVCTHGSPDLHFCQRLTRDMEEGRREHLCSFQKRRLFPTESCYLLESTIEAVEKVSIRRLVLTFQSLTTNFSGREVHMMFLVFKKK